MKKSAWFGALCLACILLVIPNCKKLPTTPDIESVVKAQIEYFTASPTEIEYGESSTLSWSTKNATTVTINQEVVSAKGEKIVSPEETTTYVLTAKNDNKTVTKSVTLEVILEPIIPVIKYFGYYRIFSYPGEFYLTWSVIDATQVSIAWNGNVLDNLELVGEHRVISYQPTTYVLIAQNDYTIENDLPITAIVRIEFTAFPSIELDWYRQNNEPATISGFVENTGNVIVKDIHIKFVDDNGGVCEAVIKGLLFVGSRVYFRAHRLPYLWEWGNIQVVLPPEITWELR